MIAEPTYTGDQRRSWLHHHATFLATQGASEEAISAFLQAENQARCTPPLEAAEIRRVVSETVDYERLERGLRSSSFDRFQSAEERRQRYALIDDEAITRLQSPGWTIDHVLPEKSLSMWHGPPGRGKTFTMLDISLSVGAGLPWFGRSVQQGNAIYVTHWTNVIGSSVYVEVDSWLMGDSCGQNALLL